MPPNGWPGFTARASLPEPAELPEAESNAGCSYDDSKEEEQHQTAGHCEKAKRRAIRSRRGVEHASQYATPTSHLNPNSIRARSGKDVGERELADQGHGVRRTGIGWNP